MALKPYFQLVRLPNLFTAAADPLAGFLIAGGLFKDVAQWLPLVLAGVCLYAAGMILNDVFDYEVDLKERPGRPLPSGRASRWVAAVLGWDLLILGPLLASLAGVQSLVVAVVLAGCVLLYDAGRVRPWRRPEVMGACRGLNLLLGMSASATLGGPAGWGMAFAFALFVIGVTYISGDEVHFDRSGGVKTGMALQNLAMLALICLAAGGHQTLTGLIGGILIFFLVGGIVNRADLRAIRAPEPGTIQLAVKTGVIMLIWLDVALVAVTRGPLLALPVAALWIPAFVLGKWLYST